jgi:DNA polymerase-3 subunit epsilon|tara:strand:+ start:180 stop:752 length:573 start_codon:yes stop_codon:yes gene_type:complete
MFLIFDTETTGLPKDYNGRISDVDNWPRVIQLAWALYDVKGRLVESRVDLIRPNGWTIPAEKFWIDNGFSQSESQEKGIPIREALLPFIEKVGQSEQLIAHNMSFDHPVLGAECVREKIKASKQIDRVCTKDEATDFCELPGKYGYKWPTLSELHIKLFGKDFEGGHDALVDVKACGECFFELRKLGIIK